jgi:hypothetical protein
MLRGVCQADNRPASDNARSCYKEGAGQISLQGHDPTTSLDFQNTFPLRGASIRLNIRNSRMSLFFLLFSTARNQNVALMGESAG